MSGTAPEPMAARDRHGGARAAHGDVDRGFAESARMWARQCGLPVPAHGRLPDEIIAQYRRRQTRE